ncbi:molecular chaperone DnaJ [Pseudomaricurvus alcaniphilus]|uniref:DNA-J related domain-containing protein n=1 Tax=Pseudomaricurvus alcaniphilus TaxID=1166482 RepID=UPI0014074013|nr:molecular chaperone DnaJ [Pseudomaricurvus alcaniphilus]
MLNPLLGTLRKLIEEDDLLPASEHQLLSRMVSEGVLARDYSSEPLGLFQAHFLLMNGLYQLQASYRSGGRGLLSISALEIALLPARGQSENSSEVAGLASVCMADYYLDWNNFSAATSDSVDELLGSFWRRYMGRDDVLQALAVLGLESLDPRDLGNWLLIKQRYRRLAMECHPDRGGDQQQFTRLQAAFTRLKAFFGESG